MSNHLKLLEKPTIILASPWDMGYLRESALRIHADLLGEPPSPNAVAMFAWEKQEETDPYDDRRGVQEQIPSPIDQMCVGVIAIFGEWIGRELPNDYNIEHLNVLNANADKLPFRLQFPWYDGAEKDGCFPLTGSTYEVLTAIAASELQQQGKLKNAPELLLFFVGPKHIGEAEDACDDHWGNNKLRNDVNFHWQNQRKEKDRRLDKIDEQLKQLKNFYHYLNICLGHVCKTIETEGEAEVRLSHFLEQNLGQTSEILNTEPFKGLGVFGINDKGIYFGREKLVSATLKRIHTLWDTSGTHIHWVRGPSGAGKSSFLQAGILSSIGQRANTEITYIKCVVRTNELVYKGSNHNNVKQHWPLRQLMGLCLAAIHEPHISDTKLLDAYLNFDESKNDHLNCALKNVREALLNKMQADKVTVRFALGLDQFEETVDRLLNVKIKESWHELITFILHLAKEKNIMIIATMRDDRIDALLNHQDLNINYSETANITPALQLPVGEDMGDIIRKPFLCIPDLVLDDDLITTLIDNVQTFQNSAHKGSLVGSYLPLISLTLERLYKVVARPIIEEFLNFGASMSNHELATKNDNDNDNDKINYENKFNKSAHKNARSQSGAFLSVELANNYNGKNYLDIKDAVAALAEEAVNATKEKFGPMWEDDTIAELLRRLVSWAGSSEQPFSLPAADWPKNHIELRLVKEMMRRRLIVEEKYGRIRLIHEAVVWNWPAAKEWLEYELPLLKDIPVLVSLAKIWATEDQPEKALDAGKYLHMDSALRLLSLWYNMLVDAQRESDPENKALLRDFCLSLLDRHGSPAELVHGTPRCPPQIMLAVAYEKLSTVRRMLDSSDDVVNLTRLDKRTSIFYSAFQNNLEIAKLLIEHNAEVDVPDINGWRPIHAAATAGSLDLAKLLLEHGASLGGEGTPGASTCLHLAAGNDQVDMIHFLIEYDAECLETVDDLDETALFRAVKNNKAKALEALIKHGAKYDGVIEKKGQTQAFGWTALHIAARQGSYDAVRVLLTEGMPGDLPLINGMTALHLAARNGHSRTVLVLCEWFLKNNKAVDISAYDKWDNKSNVLSALEKRKDRKSNPSDKEFDITPLMYAVKFGHLSSVKILLDFNADPNLYNGAGANALHLAIVADQPEIIPLLLSKISDYHHNDSMNKTVLQTALESKKWTIARTLIEAGISIDAPVRSPQYKDTSDAIICLIHQAAIDKDIERFKFLLRWKADINVRGPLGQTPLHFCAISGFTEGIRLLKLAGVSLLTSDDDDKLPLYYAVQKGNTTAVAELVNYMNTPDSLDQIQETKYLTPSFIHLAAFYGRENIVKVLIDADYMNETPDDDGFTAFHRAIQANSLAAVKHINEAGVTPAPISFSSQALIIAAQVGAHQVAQWFVDNNMFELTLVGVNESLPFFEAMRYRQYQTATVLLDTLSNKQIKDPVTKLSIAQLYLQQVTRATELNLSDARSLDFEAALKNCGIIPTMPAIAEKQQTKQVPNQTSQNNTIVIPATLFNHSKSIELPYAIGATAYFPDIKIAGAKHVWHEFQKEERVNFLKRVSPVDGKWRLNEGNTIIHWRKLPWYDDVSLLHVRSSEFEKLNIRIFYLQLKGDLFRLNGTSPCIHEVNKKSPIRLNEQNALDYLRFFTFFVRGDEGPWYVAEDIIDPMLPNFRDESSRTVLSGTLRPASFEGKNNNGDFMFVASIYYSNALFNANFAVKSSGMIDMLNDEPITGDLPEKIKSRLA